jgi:hypothetical protein
MNNDPTSAGEPGFDFSGIDVGSLAEQIFDRAADSSYAELITKSARYVVVDRLYRSGFERRLKYRWGRALFLCDLFRITARQYGSDFTVRQGAEAVLNQDLVLASLTRIHGRACLIAEEVRALMHAGFASGAMARWRSMHELAVVAFFIKEHGQEVAERYLLHEAIMRARAAEAFQESAEERGDLPLTADEMEPLLAARQELLTRYGEAYGRDWGWAAGVLPGNPTFRRIEESAGFGHARPWVGMASDSVHAGFRGMVTDVGLSGTALPEIMLAGPSNAGLAEPGRNAVYPLHLCTVALLNMRPAPDTIVGLMTLQRLYVAVGDAFLAAHRKLDRDQARIARDAGAAEPAPSPDTST